MNCYLSRNYKGRNGAGNKAKTDIEQIMQNLQFRNVGLRQTTFRQPLIGFLLTLTGVLKVPFCLRRGDVLFLQYPFKKYFTFVCKMAHWRGAKVVTVIHDLGSFRRKRLTVVQEIRRLDHADYLITHNENMKNWLKENGSKAALDTLGIFDFLSPAQPSLHSDVRPPYGIVYAGVLNRRKNSYLYDWTEACAEMSDLPFSLCLYGPGFTEKSVGGGEIERGLYTRCMGFMPPDRLIAAVEGAFGLVWEGNSLHECSGNFGEYLRYNNPHKTSLYLRCGLPVIIWDQAALAPFVKEQGIGLCVGSLKEVEGRLRTLTPAQYAEMCANVRRVGERIARGDFYREAALRAASSFQSDRAAATVSSMSA